MTSAIRVATPQDAVSILDIYAPIVRDTAISFEMEPPTLAAMQQRIAQTLPRLPWLVCSRQGELQGYAYASPHRARAAYQWSVEVSVYVRASAHRSGVGRALYTALCEILVLQGYGTAYAGITLPNAASVGLHEAHGFQPVGVFRRVGYKLGAWHDVGWWQLPLGTLADPPAPPTAFADLTLTSTAWQAALAAGSALLQR